MTAIDVRALRKTFGDVTAVDGIDLSIEPGEIVAMLGPNGAGKTTTIDMILGLTAPTSGSLRVLDASPRAAVQAGRVGAVLQTGGLLRDLTVLETVESIAALHRLPRSRVDEVLDHAQLTPIARRKVSKCSGGEQQRIKFALALLPDPDLLILDEPTTGLDVGARRAFWAAMRAQADHGRTIVFATHYLEEASDFAQRIVLMAHGRIVADGPTEQIASLTSRRTVEATLPQPADTGRLPAGATVNGRRVSVHTADSDAVARELLASGAHDLIITQPTLEDSFLALTQERAA